MLHQFSKKQTVPSSRNQRDQTSGSLSSIELNRLKAIETEAISKLSELMNKPNANRTQIIYYRQKETNNTILMLAAASNCIIGVEWLSYQPEFPSLIGQKNCFNQTALLLALFNHHIYMANILRYAGETYDAIANYRHPLSKDTFLIQAARQEILSIEKVVYLLKVIPNLWQTIDKKSKRGHTVISLLILKGNWPVAIFLLKKEASLALLLQVLPPMSVLYTAVQHGSLEALEYLLAIPEFRSLLDTPNAKNMPIILQAALKGYWKIVKYLQSLGANTDPIIDYQQEKTKNDFLMLISEKGTKEDLCVLFNIRGWQRLIGRTNTFNYTALFIACLHGNAMVAGALIEAKAGDLQQEVINFRYNGYYTILMLAIENRSTKGVQYLLTIPQIKSEADEENPLLGETALIQASTQKKNTKLSIVQSLIEAGASVVKLLSFCMPSVPREEATIFNSLTKHKKIDVIAYLLTRPEFSQETTDPECQKLNIFQQLKDALLIAALEGHLELVELLRLAILKYLNVQLSLLNTEIDPSSSVLLEYRDEQGGHLLSKVAAKGWCNFLQYLLDTFPACTQLISMPDSNGWTPLFYAHINGHKAMSTLLIFYHASLASEVINYRHLVTGNTILNECAAKGYLFGLEFLFLMPEIQAKIHAKNLIVQTALCVAAFRGEPNLVRALIQQGSNVETVTQDGQNILEYAKSSLVQNQPEQQQAYAKTIEILTASFNLMSMARGESSEYSLKKLLPQGASVHQTGENNRTPLHLSVISNSNALVEELLQEGADPLRIDDFGFNVIDYALQRNNPIALCIIYLDIIYQDLRRKEPNKAVENITDIMTIAHKASNKNTQGYIFLQIGIALKSPTLLTTIKPTLAYRCLSLVPKESTSYTEAQYQLATLFYSLKLNLSGISFLESALKYSLRSGFSMNAVVLRKEIIGKALNRTFADKRFDIMDEKDRDEFIQTYNALRNVLIQIQLGPDPFIKSLDFELLKTQDPKKILFLCSQCAELEKTACQVKEKLLTLPHPGIKTQSDMLHQLNGKLSTSAARISPLSFNATQPPNGEKLSIKLGHA